MPFFLMLPLAACGGGGDERANEAAANEAAAQANVQPETTPVLNVPADADNQLDWMGPQDAPGPRPSAPYGNLLDAPVAKGAPAR